MPLKELINYLQNKKVVVCGSYQLVDHLWISFAYNLQKVLPNVSVIKEAIYDFSKLDQDTVYIIMCSQEVKIMPSIYICYQVEQALSWWLSQESYLNKLRNAKYIIDYSMDNINRLQKIIIAPSSVASLDAPSTASASKDAPSTASTSKDAPSTASTSKDAQSTILYIPFYIVQH